MVKIVNLIQLVNYHPPNPLLDKEGESKGVVETYTDSFQDQVNLISYLTIGKPENCQTKFSFSLCEMLADLP